MTIDFEKHRISADGKRIYLTKRESEILELLHSNKDKVIKYDEISEKIYEVPFDKCIANSLKNQICKLKRKIDKYITIQNIQGTGYLIEDEGITENIEEEKSNDSFSFSNVENILPF